MGLVAPKLSREQIASRLASGSRGGDAKRYVLEFLASGSPYSEVVVEPGEFVSREGEQKDTDGVVASLRSSLTAMKNSNKAPAGIGEIEVRKVDGENGPAAALINRATSTAPANAAKASTE